MNKALFWLLVTLVQSQSHGIVLSSPNSNDHFQDSQLEDWDAKDTPYPVDVIKDYDLNPQAYRKRSITSDALTRRSTLDKNFMRFGRGGEGEEAKLSFYRFGRGLKDSFIRFGRARDNFIRFGRGGGKDGFIRFGRSRPEDFFRAGKSLRENFIRFGKADKNFMRFGRENPDEGYQDFFFSEEPFRRPGKSSRAQDNFLRFGRNGKNGTNFLRPGKSDAESDDGVETDQDSNAPKDAKRKRRFAPEGPPGGSPKGEGERSPGFFEAPPRGSPRRIFPTLDTSWQNLENLRNSRFTSFFPVYSNQPKSFDFYESKAPRNRPGNNFVNFG